MNDDIREMLERHGVTPSFHRMKIYEYLLTHRTHPSAEEIHMDIVREIPTLSKTTVYNTMKVFLAKGLVTAVTIEEDEVRYDAYTSFHAHFKCLACGKVYDIDKATSSPHAESLAGRTIQGHRVTEVHLYLRGICRICAKGGLKKSNLKRI